jgi:cell division protein FtsB
MTIICPKCKKPIKDGNILDTQDLAFCASCEEVYTISELASRQSEIPDEIEQEPVKDAPTKDKANEIQVKIAPKKNDGGEKGQQPEKRRKQAKSGLIIVIILGIVSNAVWLGLWLTRYKSMVNENSELQWRYNSLADNNSQLQKQNDELKSENETLVSDNKILSSLLKFNITSVKAGNSNNGWLTKPGNLLYSRQMKFLSLNIIYNSAIEDSITVYVKIIDPHGKIMAYSDGSSPKGFTYSSTANIKRGINQSLDLDNGIGNKDASVFDAGEWTIEIWYNNVCLISEKIRIN